MKVEQRVSNEITNKTEYIYLYNMIFIQFQQIIKRLTQYGFHR